MEPLLPSLEESQLLVSSFLQIVVGQTTAIASQFLQETRWNLHDAIRLFFYVKDSGGVSSPSLPPPANGNLSELESSIGNKSFVRDDPVDEARPSSLARLQSGQVVAPCNVDSVSRQSAARESKESASSTVSLPFPEKASKANHSFLCQKRPREYDSAFTNIQGIQTVLLTIESRSSSRTIGVLIVILVSVLLTIESRSSSRTIGVLIVILVSLLSMHT